MWHPYLQIGDTWIWSVNHLVDKELAGWMQPESCGSVIRWRLVMSGAPQGPNVGQVVFSIFTPDTDSGIECSSSKTADCSKTQWAVQLTQWKDRLPSTESGTNFRIGPTRISLSKTGLGARSTPGSGQSQTWIQNGRRMRGALRRTWGLLRMKSWT